jgi:hypothetical protein
MNLHANLLAASSAAENIFTTENTENTEITELLLPISTPRYLGGEVACTSFD